MFNEPKSWYKIDLYADIQRNCSIRNLDCAIQATKKEVRVNAARRYIVIMLCMLKPLPRYLAEEYLEVVADFTLQPDSKLKERTKT